MPQDILGEVNETANLYFQFSLFPVESEEWGSGRGLEKTGDERAWQRWTPRLIERRKNNC